MDTGASDRTGIMTVRLWIEPSAGNGFRARLTHTLDSAGSERQTATAGTPEDLYAVVRTWVESFLSPVVTRW